mgnify:CR=1 FL=1
MENKVIILDFDGVIVDTEKMHFQASKEVLTSYRINLEWKLYKEKYLALDDKGLFKRVFKDFGRKLDRKILRELCERKSAIYKKISNKDKKVRFYKGVKGFIKKAFSEGFILAIASGANRSEVESVIKNNKLDKYFKEIVCAEDVKKGKPSPEPFLEILKRLGKSGYKIDKSDCTVIEDSIHGVRAAKNIGMRVIAVTNSYSREELKKCGADLIVSSLCPTSKLLKYINSQPLNLQP